MGFILHFSHSPSAFRRHPPAPFAVDLGRNNGLASFGNVNMLHRDDLAATGANALQGKQARLIRRR
jgi:hypothetical protein